MADKEDSKASKSPKDEDELSALLDSALEDFKKDDAVGSGEKEVSKECNTQEETTAASEGVLEEWNEEFVRQTAAQFESSIASFLGINSDGNPATAEQLQQKFQEMAEAAQQVIESPTVNESSTDFAATISQTIQGLNAGAEGLQAPLNDEVLMNMFGQGGGENSLLPFMQGMMQSLLSKDVLYPSLQDILNKFPDWLNSNKSSLSSDDVSRYENQIKLMKDVCLELENEIDSDAVGVKQEKFEKVLGLMQKLQEYGQPPADLVGDVGPPLPLDLQNGMDPNQCVLM